MTLREKLIALATSDTLGGSRLGPIQETAADDDERGRVRLDTPANAKSQMITRRSFISSILALSVAPAIVP